VSVRTREVAAADWAGIAALEQRVYGPAGLAEGLPALRSRGAASPATCFVLDTATGPAGYLLALPYPAGECPDLRRPERYTHPGPDLHLHDLVVAPGFRGRGLGRELVRTLLAAAGPLGYRRIGLVAVLGSTGFWAAQGFCAAPGEEHAC
jgi:ribosomal protein S18 acetylase RimI-like enzyme